VEEAENFSDLARTRGVPLWKILLAENKITEAWLADSFSRRLRIPFAGVGPLEVEGEVAHRITETLARRHECIPVAVRGRQLHVAFVDPSNLASVQAVEFFTGSKVLPLVGLRSQILEAVEKYFARETALDIIDRAGEMSRVQILTVREDVDLDETATLESSNTPPIIKFVNKVLADALHESASDIHIEPAEHEIIIRLRVDGVLRDYLRLPEAPARVQAGLISRLKVLSKLDITERRVPQDGRFKVRSENRVTDLRVSTLPTQYGEKVVIRLLGSADGIPKPEQLGIPHEELPAVLESVKQPQGMIIVTGPTGSGKTTSLYSLLNYKRSKEVNIVTVEDPIEYQLAGANQVQINPKAGLTFAACLRSILRQDPDTILVGEVRDHETAEIAFHAAMTGHLVLTTLHTNNSVATVLRLLDLGIDPFVVTTSITLVVAQRLVRVTCDVCREQYSPDPRVLSRLGWDDPAFTFTRGKGCRACHGTGFKGRIGIYEMLRMTPAVRDAINARSSESVIRQAAVKSGVVPLLEAARNKIREGNTTPEEVMRVIQWVDEGQDSCPKCGKPLSGKSRKCQHCKTKPKLTCYSCGETMEPSWQVCPHCSSPALPRGGEVPGRGDSAGSQISKAWKNPGTLQ